MSNLWKEFREFAVKGSVVELAIGIIIGAAFSTIVNSLVNDIIMPPVGYIFGDVDFSDLFIVLGDGDYASLEQAEAAGAATINYGVFITNVIDFLIVAWVIFLVVRLINRLRREEEAAPPPPTKKDCPYCHTNIPLKASRCPNCTSELEVAEGTA
jgi:large conductance mechanosensitive channel